LEPLSNFSIQCGPWVKQFSHTDLKKLVNLYNKEALLTEIKYLVRQTVFCSNSYTWKAIYVRCNLYLLKFLNVVVHLKQKSSCKKVLSRILAGFLLPANSVSGLKPKSSLRYIPNCLKANFLGNWKWICEMESGCINQRFCDWKYVGKFCPNIPYFS